jgi:organic radical activating enzyme
MRKIDALAEPGGAGPSASLSGSLASGERAFVNEIFCSAQGEGTLVGDRQIFVRLAGCNIRCPWCDTPDALVAKDSPEALVEITPGGGDARRLPNPLGVPEVMAEVRRIAAEHGPVRWVALTGGEPMIWGAFLRRLLPEIRAAGLRTFLETNSHYPDTLRAILPWVDFVSADVKVPFADYDIAKEKYRDFLGLVPRGALQVKVVVTADCPDEDVLEAARITASIDRGIPFILQPVTPEGPVRARPEARKLLDLQRRCLEIVDRVLLIPQTHKLYGVR